jgi:hypothetical protein
MFFKKALSATHHHLSLLSKWNSILAVLLVTLESGGHPCISTLAHSILLVHLLLDLAASGCI